MRPKNKRRAKKDKLATKELNLVTMTELFSNEDKAREFIEALIWSDGIPVCPHCNSKGAYKLNPKPDAKKSVRKGVWKCKKCRKQFTVTVGTIMEDSHIALTKWIMAYYLFVTSKKSISAYQLHRVLDIEYTTAWHIFHRMRHSMTNGGMLSPLKGTVEVDETYIGRKPRAYETSKRGRGTKKTPLLAMVERKGEVRTKVIANVTAKTLKGAIRDNISPKAKIMTDEFRSYNGLDKEFKKHETVNHGRNEFVRGKVTTNTVEAFFGLLKRAVYGTWHHVSKEHLHRYATEFEFRWNNRKLTDSERMRMALKLSVGKRLMYKDAIAH